MENYCKVPCKHCPYRNDVTPFLTMRRAEELAYAPENPYNDFPCHKTFEYDGGQDHQGRPTGDFSSTKTCAGFLTMRAQAGVEVPEGFEPSWEICYIDSWDMIAAYEEHFEENGESEDEEE